MRWVEWLVAVMFAITGISFIFAVMTTTVANTFVICSVGPLLGALLSRVLLREAIAKRIWIAASVVFVGLVVIFFDSLATGGWAGDCAALVAAFATSINFVVIRKYREINMFPALAWSYALVALMALPNAQPASLTLNDWALMLLLGLFIVPISQAMMTLGPRYLPAPEVSLIQRLEALLAPLLVWLIIGEVPSVATLQGGCLILITLIIVAILAINEETKWRRSLR
jgi:drug/metabolite transporter (DMT)-like permease